MATVSPSPTSPPNSDSDKPSPSGSPTEKKNKKVFQSKVTRRDASFYYVYKVIPKHKIMGKQVMSA